MIRITDHAYERAKQRFSWNQSALEKMALKAYEEGLRHSMTKGSLHRYITKLWFEYKTADNIRVYGQNIFFFQGNVLITLYQLPNSLKNLAKVLIK